MATKRKASTKKDLEDKIAELEKKLSVISSQIETPKPKKAKPAEKPSVKPKETLPKSQAKPAEKPSVKPKGTLPKGFEKPAEVKPAEKPKAKPAEKPSVKPKETLPKGFEKPVEAETSADPPATIQDALENAYNNAPQTDFHQYRAKVTGYSPAPNRYFVRRTAPVGKIPTTNWNEQKTTVTGYTQPSNQYFATRARLAYHPPDKTFGGFSGANLSVEGQTAKQVKETLPKDAGQAPPPQQVKYSSSEEKSKGDKLAEYEKDYLQRIENQKIEQEKEIDRLLEEESKRRSSATRGSLPKGFEPKPEAPKQTRGTLPKGF